MAGNHWNRFGDMRRVRLSNPELRTLSAAPDWVREPIRIGGLQGCSSQESIRDIRRVRLSHAEV
eukprot:1572258-Pyramimonas_sp.AAC.1